MSFRFTRAIVRPPDANFAQGLTTAALGPPDVALALEQHEAYCRALEQCGLRLTRLPVDDHHPDATFVEDTAVLAERVRVLTRPGAPSREGEVAAMREVFHQLGFPAAQQIEPPGTLDGGDVCEAGEHFFIGVSARTNWEGGGQLASMLDRAGYSSSSIDMRGISGILHLKSGIAALGDGRILAVEPLASLPALRHLEVVRVDATDAYAANCVRVNDRVLLAAGYPRVRATLERLGLEPLELEMSEFRKMDGGLSCLSLRF